ncbi:MAG: cupin domain-containing protein [Polyangiaceae bacterium]
MAQREPQNSSRDSEHELADELLEQALDALSPASMPVGRERLLRAAQSPPLRYAPFFKRMGELWALPEAAVEAAVAESARAPWRWLWPGIRCFNVVTGATLQGAQGRMLHLQPSVRFPLHRHDGEEQVLVLEGSYTDSSGLHVRAGDLQTMPAGTEHELRVSADSVCVAALVERGQSFGAPWLSRLRRALRP